MRGVMISLCLMSVGERGENPEQVIGLRLVERAVMEPPHDAFPVEDDQVGIVFMRGRIGQPLLSVACASVDRDDVVRATARLGGQRALRQSGCIDPGDARTVFFQQLTQRLLCGLHA